MLVPEYAIMDLVRTLGQGLPRFADGRIDYTDARVAPVVSAFVQSNEEVLLLKRSQKVGHYQGKWCGVAGYLDSTDQPPIAKVLEEVNEETGIRKAAISRVRFGENYSWRDGETNKSWIVYPALVKVSGKPRITLDEEHTEHAWIKPHELRKFETVPNLDTSLRNALS
ncbi:MAG: NUDIX domain-containing protein [Candidatus Aenigmatarchaeota archaeon]|nr:MAG: NUDIX domain-containing protein [Candidatus Aenigmarchaeota archaeon]